MSSRLSLRALLREVLDPPHLELPRLLLPRRELLGAIWLVWPLVALGARRLSRGQAAPRGSSGQSASEPCLWIGHHWQNKS